MKYFFALLMVLAFTWPVNAQNNIVTQLQARSKEFLDARIARKSEIMQKFYDPEEIKQIHEFLKYQYVSIKEDMAKGIFTKAYVERSLYNDSKFGDAYKEGLGNFLFKNGNIDKELERAFLRYLAEYPYKIAKYEIKKVDISPDGKTAIVHIVEDRILKDDKTQKDKTFTQAAPRELKWLLRNGKWYLATDKPANL